MGVCGRQDSHDGAPIGRLAVDRETLGVVPVGVDRTARSRLRVRVVTTAVTAVATTTVLSARVGSEDDLRSTFSLIVDRTGNQYDEG